MKRFTILLLSLLLATQFVSAQQKVDYGMYQYQDAKNPQMARHVKRQNPLRQEIIIPQVNGYNVYKVDLHTHTMFSDGQAMPDFRVKEAWCDGLDAIAITDTKNRTVTTANNTFIAGFGK